MLNFILKKETILTSFYTILLSLLISKFLVDYTFSDKSIYDFFHFMVLFIIFFNSWLLEVVHLNRYGKDSFINYFFLISQILVILNLLVRNSLNIKYILATLILLSVILSVQHITEYILTDKKYLMIKKLTEPFCYIHTGRTLSLLLGLIFIDYCYWFILLTFTPRTIAIDTTTIVMNTIESLFSNIPLVFFFLTAFLAINFPL